MNRSGIRTFAIALPLLALSLVAAVTTTTHARAAIDGHKSVNLGLYHNGWDTFYRNPFGAAATGSVDHFRLRSSRAVTKATFYVVNEATGSAKGYPMSVQFHNGTQNFWQVSVTMPSKPVQVGYHFSAQAGKTVRWYGDNSNVGESGSGQSYSDASNILDYELTVYQAGFTTPAWVHKAVIYQVFPDRFYNGDTSNDPVNGTKYGYITVIFHKNWDSLPVENSPCQDGSGFGNNNCDFFGGDLQGVIDKLPYLQSLGITAIYLNPIFLAPSNHKYDTSNFMQIDPEFGTLQTFQTLVADAKTDGIHIILDGAFEETGADSIYFDKYGRFKKTTGIPGAYDSKSSPYYNFFTFYSWPSIYQEWYGIATLPKLQETLPVQNYIFRKPGSVAPYWLSEGASGWRLDSADQMSDAWWQAFRTAIKTTSPDSVIIGEDFSGDPTPQLSGTDWDGSMNYRFRDPILDFFANGQGAETKAPMSASAFLETEIGLISEVPWPAVLSSMNIVDSHDTIRVLSALNGNKKALRLLALYQMTWPGAPTVYYGDETGLLGLNDPDDRRTFPWDHQDMSLESYYSKIIHVRLADNALTLGSVTPLLMSDSKRTVAYERQYGAEKDVIALNDSSKTQTVSLPVNIPNGAILADQMTGATVKVAGGQIKLTLPSLTGMVLRPAA